MTSYFYANSEIALGYDNTAGLAPWESLVPGGSPIKFFAPVVYGSYDPGEEHTNTDGTPYFGGFALVAPVWGVVTQWQAYYCYHTICNDVYWAKATVKFRAIDPDTWSVYNTLIRMKKLKDQQKQSMAFPSFAVSYTRLRFIS